MIEVSGLSKVFRVHRKEPGLMGSLRALFNRQWIEKNALDSVDLKIREGEMIGLVGANGAGKTTLVKILSGVIHPTSGRASVLGFTPWERKNEFRRQISLIMGQKAQLWWDLPAADCFLLLREIYQVPKPQFQKSLDELTQILNVGPILKIQIRRLSLGERMKVELMASLLHRPRVVFLDEPTIGLDIMAQRAVREFLLRYQRESGTTMIITSHYMQDIEHLCKRIVIIREGKFVYDGPLSKVISTYAQHKILSLKVDESVQLDRPKLETFGEIVQLTEAEAKIKVSRTQIAQKTAQMLQTFQVVDLSVEDPDISTTIEAIMKDSSLRL